jgi:hypothetical protein
MATAAASFLSLCEFPGGGRANPPPPRAPSSSSQVQVLGPPYSVSCLHARHSPATKHQELCSPWPGSWRKVATLARHSSSYLAAWEAVTWVATGVCVMNNARGMRMMNKMSDVEGRRATATAPTTHHAPPRLHRPGGFGLIHFLRAMKGFSEGAASQHTSKPTTTSAAPRPFNPRCSLGP